MPVDLETLVVTIEANRRDFERGMARLEGITVSAMRKVDKALDASRGRQAKFYKRFGDMVAGGVKSAMSQAGAAILGGLALERVGQAIGQAISKAADIGEIAERIGITTDAMQALNKQFLELGTSEEQTAKGLQSIAEQAATAGSFLDKLFQANGQSLRDANGELRPMIDIYRQLAEMIQNASNESERLAIATGVMGDRIGREMVEGMAQGAEGFDRAVERMVASGNYLKSEEVKEAERIRDAFMHMAGEVVTYFQRDILAVIAATKREVDALTAALNFAGTIWNKIEGRTIRQGELAIYPDGTAPASALWQSSPEFGGRYAGAKTLPTTPLAVSGPTKMPPSGGGGGGRKSAGRDDQYDREIAHFEEQARQQEIAAKDFAETQKAAAEASAEAWDDFGQDFGGIMRGIIDGLRSGASSAEVLAGALDQIGDKALDKLFGMMFSGGGGPGGAGGGGLFGDLFGGLFGGARAKGGPVRAGQTYLVGEKGEEFFTPSSSGFITPNHAIAPAGGGAMSYRGGDLIVQGNLDNDVLPKVRRMMAEQAYQQSRELDRSFGARSARFGSLKG